MLVNNLAVAWVITLLKKYPTPSRMAAARLSTLEKIPYLKRELAQKLQAAARNTTGCFHGQVAEALVKECVEQLDHCRKSEKRLEKLLQQVYEALPASAHVHVLSIPGIGPVTAAVLVAKMICIERFPTPENLVGYFGVFPEENTSGVDRWGHKVPPGTMHMSAKGCDLIRRYLWNAAKSAIQHNTAVRDLYVSCCTKSLASGLATHPLTNNGLARGRRRPPKPIRPATLRGCSLQQKRPRATSGIFSRKGKWSPQPPSA